MVDEDEGDLDSDEDEGEIGASVAGDSNSDAGSTQNNNRSNAGRSAAGQSASALAAAAQSAREQVSSFAASQNVPLSSHMQSTVNPEDWQDNEESKSMADSQNEYGGWDE